VNKEREREITCRGAVNLEYHNPSRVGGIRVSSPVDLGRVFGVGPVSSRTSTPKHVRSQIYILLSL